MIKTPLFFLAFFILLITDCKAQDISKDLVAVSKKMRNKDFTGAKKDLEKYINKHAGDKYAWILYGHVYFELDDDSLAILSYEKALEIDPGSGSAYTALGILFRRKGDYDKAAYYYYRAITVEPGYSQAWTSLSIIEIKRKNFSKAVDAGLKAYELDKKEPIIAANLSTAYHYNGDTVNREKYFKIAESLGYPSLTRLRKIFSGELTLLDD